MSMERFTLNPLADASLVDAIRVHAQWQEPCDVEERDGLLLVAGSTRFPGAYLNCVVRTDDSVTPEALIGRSRSFFGPRDRGFTVITRASRDAALEDALAREPGFEQRAESPCMAVTARVAEPVPADGITLQAMTEPKHVVDAAQVHAQAYAVLGTPESVVQKLFAHPARVLATPVIGCVAYRAGEPVASALAIQSGPAAGVYWVGTVPSASRLGLATLCTAWVTNRSIDAGAANVNLQASALGAPVYERMGYGRFDRMRWFVCRAAG